MSADPDAERCARTSVSSLISASIVPSNRTWPFSSTTARSETSSAKCRFCSDSRMPRPPPSARRSCAPSARRSPARRLRTARRAAPGTGCPSACARPSASAARRRSCGRRGGRASRRDWGTARTGAPASRRRALARRLARDLEVLQHREVGEDAPVLGHAAEAEAGDAIRRQAPRCRGRERRSGRAGVASRPIIAFSVVDLPAPLRPISATHSPRAHVQARRRTGSAPGRTRRRAP